MKAIVHEGKTGMAGLSLKEMEVGQPGEGEVRVKLKTAGMNHRDLFVLHRHKLTDPPLVIGSDGAGIIDAVGKGVTSANIGDEVIINPGLGWREKSDAPPEEFDIVGLPGHGTFAEYIVIPAENAIPRPEHLIWEEAGVFGLAALTGYRALFTRGKITPDMTILLPGVGSGVITFILKFAKTVGTTVYVTSRSEEKRQRALELGADKAIDSDGDWNEQLSGEKVDLVIESVGAATFSKSLGQLRPGGTIVTFGASAGDEINLDLRTFFYGQYNMLGTTMGSAEEFKEMIEFVEKHKIKPEIEAIFPLSKYEIAFNRLEEAEQFGKVGFLID
ncbi:zinc-binding dehydrogenase [Bacillus norwichensis]|uniref:Zinc-binding dehydrogenase n=1 Tax=Bacillus norwichensis TaxID=2762217 RepID=A0ABR8VHZ2_9BACI|nr:zinc-binding dehydrogenase [Bacillus norwichensis]MBD8004394.1 zinc-binding dehydrogenase [Bacillus norwichensis]